MFQSFLRNTLCMSFILFSIHSAYASEKSAINALKNEPRVKDMVFKKGDVVEWHLGVLSDGKSQVGFAMYACNVLLEHKVVHSGTWVRIVDIVKVKNGSSFREASLGRANCSTWKTKPR